MIKITVFSLVNTLVHNPCIKWMIHILEEVLRVWGVIRIDLLYTNWNFSILFPYKKTVKEFLYMFVCICIVFIQKDN